MKTILSILFCLLLFSCTNSGNKKPDAAAASNEDMPTTSSIKKRGDATAGGLIQKNDYSALFNRDPGDCGFINAEGIAKAINVPIASIEKAKRNCAFNVIESNGNKTTFFFTIEPWGNKTVLKEIEAAKKNAESFGKNSKLSQYRLSETGDTYLSMHQNRIIRILNEKNENVIKLLYSTEVRATETNNLKDVARARSYAIANYIINTHKNK